MNSGVELAVRFASLLLELLVLLFVVAGAIALTVRRAGLRRLQRWLGGSRTQGALKGIAAGFVMPFCSYSAIPTFIGMVDAGVRTATLAGFLLAAPLLDPLVFAVLWLLFGWQATVTYAGITAATVFVLALGADLWRAERMLHRARRRVLAIPAPTTSGPSVGCQVDPFSDEQPWRGARAEATDAVRYAASLLRDLALPMALAVAVAAAIVGVVPDHLVARLAGPDNPLAVPTAAVLGAPFYVSTEAMLPVASALHDSGMGLGAAFALVISAAGVNLPELTLLSRLMRPGLLAAYAGAVVSAAVAAGYAIPLLV